MMGSEQTAASPMALRAELARLQADFDRLQRLHQVSLVLHASLDADQVLQVIVDEAVRLLGAASGSVMLLNPDGLLHIEASSGLPPEARQARLHLGQGITGWVARTGRPARVEDVRSDPRYVPLREAVRSELAVPLEVEGVVRGVLNVDADHPGAFSEADQELLLTLAGQAARVIHHAWLHEQARHKTRLLETLVAVGQTINSALNLDEALQGITRQACLLMNARMCSLLMLDESGQWLDLRAHFGAGPAYLNKPRLSVEESLAGAVARRRKPIQEWNVQESARYANVAAARAEGLVSLLCVPLLHAGRSIGVLNAYKAVPYKFSNEEIGILSAFADLSAIAIEKARLYERVVDLEEQLRQSEKLSALGLLAAEVAHEIRNPLTVLKILFQSLELRYPPDDPRCKDTELISEKIEQLNRTVERMLDFARGTEPREEAVDLNRLVEELCLLIRHKLSHQGVTLERRLASGLPTLRADATQLEQALLNLALNAAEAMPGGGRLTIATSALRVPRHRPDPTHLRVTVSDTGPGMSAEAQRRVQEGLLLRTTKPRGTGLGLAIVKRVVETHQGRLRIRAVPGRGTRVSIILPVRRPAGVSESG